LPVAQLLVERGADLSLRVKLPGHYQRPGEVVECTPLGYALLFPGTHDRSPTRVISTESRSVTLLRNLGAPES